MTDTDSEVTRARTALSGPATVADPAILGAVHSGLLSVPTDGPDVRIDLDAAQPFRTAPAADPASLAVRRRETA